MARKRRNGQLVCGMCDRAFPDDEFPFRKNRDGMYRAPWCRTCRNAYMREQMRAWRLTPKGKASVRAASQRQKMRRREEGRAETEWRRQSSRRALGVLLSAGWTRGRIAEAVGVTPKSVTGWTLKGSVPRPTHAATLRRLARAAEPRTSPRGA